MRETPFQKGIDACNAGQLAASDGDPRTSCQHPEGYEKDQWLCGFDYGTANPSPRAIWKAKERGAAMGSNIKPEIDDADNG